jgi:hypothetical protein
MRITLDELRKATEILFDYIERCGHKSFEIDADYYWYIHRKQDRYDPRQEPSNFSLGQLSSDIEDLKAVLDGQYPTSHHLIPLAAVFEYIGDKIVK